MSWYNTLNESKEVTALRNLKTLKQEKIILELYRLSFPDGLTPSEVFNLLNSRFPLTSVRRSITDLTSKYQLKKTGNKRMGFFGVSNYVWIINIPQPPPLLTLF